MKIFLQRKLRYTPMWPTEDNFWLFKGDYIYLSLIVYISRHYDSWGQRIDEIVTSTAWKRLHAISAEEGLVAIAYERSHNQWR